jgi:biopolymer transport protein ExbD
MAVMKKKRKGGIPPISTASLPDVIFMILFFFMISTSMREMDVLVKTQLPNATEVSKLEKKQLVSYIYIGQPVESQQAQYGTAPRIQLNDKFSQPKDILDFVASERDKLSEADRQAMTVMIKADKNTRMGIVADVKMQLRVANALKISYAANKSLAVGN